MENNKMLKVVFPSLKGIDFEKVRFEASREQC